MTVNSHERLVKETKDMVTRIVTDFSVMPEDALNSLYDLKEFIEEAIGLLYEDIEDEDIDIY